MIKYDEERMRESDDDACDGNHYRAISEKRRPKALLGWEPKGYEVEGFPKLNEYKEFKKKWLVEVLSRKLTRR